MSTVAAAMRLSRRLPPFRVTRTAAAAIRSHTSCSSSGETTISPYVISRRSVHPATGQPPHHSRGSGGKSFSGGRQPVKDRYPPVTTDLADPRRRLAILVDGTNTGLLSDGGASMTQIQATSALYTNVLAAVQEVGVPVLLRVFAHQLPSAWDGVFAGGVAGTAPPPSDQTVGGGLAALPPLTLIPAAGPSAAASPLMMQVEYFRVERFIPIAMQMEADARHLYEFRHMNKVEGVCYVCHEVDRSLYVSLMEEQCKGSAPVVQQLLKSAEAARGGRHGDEAVAMFFNQYLLDELGMASEMPTDGRSKNGA